MTTGEELRAQGVEAVLASDCAIHRNYGALCKDVIADLIEAGRPFTAEDVRRHVADTHPQAWPHHPNVLPAILGSLARRGQITAVGMTKATRRSRHGSRNLVWVGGETNA